ncbi:MAG TPA: Hsp20/alpha crystallin family protein [Burkholderiales bacterium]|nr:Hsp20/alpha crystallin family protein [Burkholderiales bacterium]
MATQYEQQAGSDVQGNQSSSGQSASSQNQSTNVATSGQQGAQSQSSSGQQQGQSGQGGELMRRGEGGAVGWPWSSPFSMMNRMMEDMDRLFEGFGFRPSRLSRLTRDLLEDTRSRVTWTPQIEVSERDGQLVVCADLPGLRKEDVKVEVTQDALTIQGERRGEQTGQGYSERFYGNFYRAIPLPEGINADEAQAKFQDGVLEVTIPMPKRQQSQARRLDVK